MKLRTLRPKVTPMNTAKLKLPPKQVDPIYHTPEYLAWRAKVIARAKGKCQDEQHQGAHEPGCRLYADHVKELKDGGAPFDVSNGLARCATCHGRKTTEARAARRWGGSKSP